MRCPGCGHHRGYHSESCLCTHDESRSTPYGCGGCYLERLEREPLPSGNNHPGTGSVPNPFPRTLNQKLRSPR